MMINQALNLAEKKFKAKKITSAELDAEVLLCNSIKKTREFVFINGNKELTNLQTKNFEKLVKRREKLEPIAYIIGYKEFYNIKFEVDKNVLIPRPETELLIDEVLNLRLKNDKIADIGTGSGCIAITLAKKIPNAKIYASDISKKALNVARKNAKKKKVKIIFKNGNLIEPLKKINPEIIIANLPYLHKKIAKNPGLKFEPKNALYGGKNGLKFYEQLLKQIKQFKLTPKIILCEIDPMQTKNFKKILKKYLPDKKFEVKKDLSQRNRIIEII